MVSSNYLAIFFGLFLLIALGASHFYYDNYCTFAPYPIVDSSSFECRLLGFFL